CRDGQAGAGGAPACPAGSARDFGRGHGARHRSRKRLRSCPELIPQTFASGSHSLGQIRNTGKTSGNQQGTLRRTPLPCSNRKGCEGGLGACPLAPRIRHLGDIRGGGSLLKLAARNVTSRLAAPLAGSGHDGAGGGTEEEPFGGAGDASPGAASFGDADGVVALFGERGGLLAFVCEVTLGDREPRLAGLAVEGEVVERF